MNDEPVLPNLNIFIACSMTCWARLCLYAALDMLQEWVLYTDTNGIIFFPAYLMTTILPVTTFSVTSRTSWQKTISSPNLRPEDQNMATLQRKKIMQCKGNLIKQWRYQAVKLPSVATKCFRRNSMPYWENATNWYLQTLSHHPNSKECSLTTVAQTKKYVILCTKTGNRCLNL